MTLCAHPTHDSEYRCCCVNCEPCRTSEPYLYREKIPPEVREAVEKLCDEADGCAELLENDYDSFAGKCLRMESVAVRRLLEKP